MCDVATHPRTPRDTPRAPPGPAFPSDPSVPSSASPGIPRPQLRISSKPGQFYSTTNVTERYRAGYHRYRAVPSQSSPTRAVLY